MKDKTSVTSSLSNKQSLTDAQVNAGFGFNTILESPDLNGQLYDIDSQVNIITKELCNFLTDNGVTLNSNDNTQFKTLMTALFSAKQNTLTAGANITIDENGVISAAAGELPNVPLFFHTWFDFKPVNIGWVNASNYSWLYGSMYQVAYQTLVDQYTPTGTFVADTSYYNCEFSDGQVVITTVPSNSGTLQQLKDWCDANSYTYNAAASIDELECYKTVSSSSETVAGTTITYYRTFNDMKIVVGDTQIANAESIYNSTGVAWYYILDTVNQRFKLPRTKFAETGLRDTVGNYVAAGLPNITGDLNNNKDRNVFNEISSGCFRRDGETMNTWATVDTGSSATGNHTITFDASKSNSIYGNSTTVQPSATQMYLYFYMGNFTQTAIENTAGLNASLFNEKVDLTGDQTIEGVKGFRSLKTLAQEDPNEGGEIIWEGASGSNGKPIKTDRYQDAFRVFGTDSNNTTRVLLSLDFEAGKAYTSNPVTNSNESEISTTYWVNKRTAINYSAGVAKTKTGFTATEKGNLNVRVNNLGGGETVTIYINSALVGHFGVSGANIDSVQNFMVDTNDVIVINYSNASAQNKTTVTFFPMKSV